MYILSNSYMRYLQFPLSLPSINIPRGRECILKLSQVPWIYCPRQYIWWSPLWSSGQNSWLQIQRSGFDFRQYQIFWEVVNLERGPLSLVSTTENLLERKSSVSGLGNRDNGRKGSAELTTRHPLSAKLALTSPTSGGRSVDVVRSSTKAMEFFCLLFSTVVPNLWYA
jgi:hypothetical protein